MPLESAKFMLKPLLSNPPPSCGEVSSTIFFNTPVKFAPLIAGSVPVMFAAGKLVKFAPEPLKVVEVVTPVANISPSLLKVIPLPTTIPFLAVINPTESTFVTSS